jgi:hypothetical protein
MTEDPQGDLSLGRMDPYLQDAFSLARMQLFTSSKCRRWHYLQVQYPVGHLP